jgi:predicted SAM-dependent methyltransferase
MVDRGWRAGANSIEAMPSTATDLPRRLNYGCGFDKREGYLNVDSDPACEPDMVVVGNDLSSLPSEWFNELLALDVLEHIPRMHTPNVLFKWSELLAVGGTLRIQTSSIEGVAAQIAKDQTFSGHYSWTHCLFGTQAHFGDFHFTGFTNVSLRVHLLAAGFDVDRIWTTEHWLLNAQATKVKSWSSFVSQQSRLTDEEFVRAAFLETLEREADGPGLEHLLDGLSESSMSRHDVVAHLLSSPERLFVTAENHGFERLSATKIAERVRPRISHVLRAPLRRLRTTARSATERGRRALGSLNGHRSAP